MKRAESPFLFLKMASNRLEENAAAPGGTAEGIVGFPDTPSDAAVVGRVWSLLEPVCASEGLELVQVEYGRESGGRVLRVYLDRLGGISLDDCVGFSRRIGDLLDVHLEAAGPYRLEVSSPGIDRPLGKVSDFERFRGENARIRTRSPIHGRRNFSGIIAGLAGDRVRLTDGNRSTEIPLEAIRKARLVNYNGED